MFNLKKLLLFSAVLVLLLALSTSVTFAAENKTGIVNAAGVNLRSGPGTSNSVVATLPKGQTLTILSESENWINVKTSSGKAGWVSNTYITIKNTTALTSRSNVARPVPNNPTDVGLGIVDAAKEMLGVKYVWGGSSPEGFDCSGFVNYVYDQFNIDVDRTSSSMANQGTTVPKAELMPGDLVFFDTNGGHNQVNHVGIYIGEGNFIHASSGSSAKKVVISSLSSGFYEDSYMHAKRFIQ